MEQLRCRSCNFSFRGVRIPRTCPNCGKEGSLFEEKSAEEIIEEIE